MKGDYGWIIFGLIEFTTSLAWLIYLEQTPQHLDRPSCRSERVNYLALRQRLSRSEAPAKWPVHG